MFSRGGLRIIGEIEAIRIVGLIKAFGDLIAVDNLDIDVLTGEIFGFLSPNGAGKSTTIRLLLDQLRATSGGAQVLGRDTHPASLEIRRRIGYCPAISPSTRTHRLQIVASLARPAGPRAFTWTTRTSHAPAEQLND